MMWRHYVYIHIRKDDGIVFYVGKGSMRKRDKRQLYERAHSSCRRSKWWNRVVAKHGLVVQIIASCKTDAEGQRIEKLLIKQHGRIQLRTGTLINLTDGGDGHAGILMSRKQRKRRSELASRPRTKAWIESIRRARKNGGNGGVVKKGDTLPQWWKDRIAAGKIGERNPMFNKHGDDHPQSRSVVDSTTGERFASVTEAGERFGIKLKTLYNMLTGHRPNRTPLRFE